MFTESGTPAWPDHSIGSTFGSIANSARAVTRIGATCLLALMALVAARPLHDGTLTLPMADLAKPAAVATAATPIAPVIPQAAASLPVDLTNGRFGLLDAKALDEYRALQASLDKADWATFDGQIKRLSDDRLLTAFIGLKLLSDAYSPSQAELAAWLTNNKSAALSTAVYSRAVALYGKNPAFTLPTATGPLSGDDREADGHGDRALPAGLIQAVATIVEPTADVETAQTETAKADDTGAAALDTPNWKAGLTAWQAGDYGTARATFMGLSMNQSLHKWDRAGALFWMGRAAAAMQDMDGAKDAWQDAAKLAPRSFYGLLAAQSLGKTPSFTWPATSLTPSDLKQLTGMTAGTRALMWLELGDRAMAEAELRQALGNSIVKANAPQRRAILMLAQSEHLPNLAFGLAGQASGRNASMMLPALYPVPAWQPKGGFVTSTALVYALMRQESAFNPIARSTHGAMGAMQIMPDTAARMTRGPDDADALAARLLHPESNIELGEKYLQSLSRDGAVRNNLIKLIAAYNCGSGNLQRWMDGNTGSDPLLYIEQLPVRETRSFVQIVMANYWMYQSQLGESPTTLKTMAKGDWPRLDFKQSAVTELASAR